MRVKSDQKPNGQVIRRFGGISDPQAFLFLRNIPLVFESDRLITQHELEAYRALKEKTEACNAALYVDREDFIAREAKGEAIEPGPLTMKVGLRQVRAFSFDAVAEIIGLADATAMKALIPEKQSKVLSVGKS
jgi:protein-L-isoaspartate O-methyltransferase